MVAFRLIAAPDGEVGRGGVAVDCGVNLIAGKGGVGRDVGVGGGVPGGVVDTEFGFAVNGSGASDGQVGRGLERHVGEGTERGKKSRGVELGGCDDAVDLDGSRGGVAHYAGVDVDAAGCGDDGAVEVETAIVGGQSSEQVDVAERCERGEFSGQGALFVAE